jgi:hypothetical protein
VYLSASCEFRISWWLSVKMLHRMELADPFFEKQRYGSRIRAGLRPRRSQLTTYLVDALFKKWRHSDLFQGDLRSQCSVPSIKTPDASFVLNGCEPSLEFPYVGRNKVQSKGPHGRLRVQTARIARPCCTSLNANVPESVLGSRPSDIPVLGFCS